ncbi:fungal specific transcription factor domain-containing protein [Aspergillus neoniger CBS 115656]|uniref:Transcription factor domain-containing protein n=1 Tax=Aspergillus neoniger (strain CBS 115656) TaxID=1448310 RepID=A0A318YDW7_ASPNB|nr:hypothetical protein BO87DRAFT_400112 [Aspergillus neoniger CBS 115656]PYH30880.1 hypothetical protein BO87DRAFT_400112 [Aspergillus neoniger CBS 115656]
MSGRPHRRRRTEVACRCVHDVSIGGENAGISSLQSLVSDAQRLRDKQDLARRIEMLEDKVGHGTGSQTHSPGSSVGKTVSEITSVDELATHAFSETSLGHVYFGSSSNYAMFRLISNAFAESALLHLTLSSHTSTAIQSCSITEGKTNRFSTTIGAILPYVNCEALLKTYEKALLERPPRFQRVFLALLNVVWAHASASLQLPEAEVFYSHCAGLLDQRTLERPTLELVQTLLLKSLYEQNHQRSTLSYTTHTNCVRASLQIGFRCASVRSADGYTLGSLHQRLWLGVLNNDITSNTILDGIIERLYDQNLDSGHPLNIQTIIDKRDNLHFHLEQWADSLPECISLLPSEESLEQSVVLDARWAVRVLLCIQCHRLELTMNFPLTMKLLEPYSIKLLGNRTRKIIQRGCSQILQDDWLAIQEVQRLISHISTLQGFIDLYASWYTCNYTIFTAILHCLALFLVRQQYPLESEPTPTQIRQEIEACLSTMRNISRGSIVNQKADYCIQRLSVVFDALVNQPQEDTSNPLDTLTTEFIFQHIKLPTEEFLNQCSRHEESEQAQLFLDIFSSIPLCE